MTTATAPARMRAARAPWVGLGAAVVLVALAAVVPPLTGWDVSARSNPDGAIPPLHGLWDPRWFGPGTLPALLLAAAGSWWGLRAAERLPWRSLLATSYVVALAWSLALAATDGADGIAHVMAHGYEYGETARSVTDVSATLEGWVPRIDPDHPDNWVTHVAGHPPLALLFFVGLVRIGLGGDLAMGLAVAVVAASVVPAVLTTLRALGVEEAGRRAAPFLALGPAAVFMVVSADAVFTAVGAWGLAALAVAATAGTRGRVVAWSALAGLVLGASVLMSYGLPLLGFLALAVLAAARSWRPLPVAVLAALAALAVVLAFAVAGFAWWEAYPELHERYWRGLAKERPWGYWVWGNLAALAICAGPLLGAGLGRLAALRSRADRVVLLLVAGAAAAVVLADLSGMSKAEVERIWLPFVPWLLVSTALLPERWRRWGLVLQVVFALLLEHLLYTSW